MRVIANECTKGAGVGFLYCLATVGNLLCAGPLSSPVCTMKLLQGPSKCSRCSSVCRVQFPKSRVATIRRRTSSKTTLRLNLAQTGQAPTVASLL